MPPPMTFETTMAAASMDRAARQRRFRDVGFDGNGSNGHGRLPLRLRESAVVDGTSPNLTVLPYVVRTLEW
jgi:hypothetical protein